MTFDPTNSRGYLGAAFMCSGSLSDYADEPMSEVDRATEGYARYTWYKVTSDAKRYADRSVVPTIQADVGGNSAFVTITPAEIHYEGMWVRLSTARGATDVVRVHDGKYLNPGEVLGVLDWTLTRAWKEITAMHVGDTAPITILAHKTFEAKANQHWMRAQASLTTSGGNANSHVTLTHEPGGIEGNLVSIELVDPGTTGSLSVSVIGQDITVTLAYATGAITTTATQLAAALNCPAVLSLGVTAKIADGETGAGIVAALAHTHLAGGTAAENYGYTNVPVVLVLYNHEANDDRTEGLAIIPNFDVKSNAGDLVTGAITFKSCGFDWQRHVG